ncbi:MAG TPA: glycoside hydrolase family 88 protein [Opitutaceae bacterium]|nr:glycoside hydrolase family 88 protein [Opitutaceae bacterium]
MKTPLSIAIFLTAAFSLSADEVRQFNGATPLEWSRKLADSEMARYDDRLFHGGANPRARWDYTTSLLGLSMLKLADATGDRAYAEWGAKTVESFVADDGSIRTYKMEEFNIDMIPPGKVMLARWEQGVREPRLRTAIETMREQMQKHPRTSDGGFWHKLRYPHQMWLDGLFMASPFLAHYGKVFEEPAMFDEVAKQVSLMDKHAYDPRTGLHYHAWDEKREQPWANKETGRSPNFWSRAIGWYGMGLVDSLDFFSPTHPEVEHINEILRRVADGIVRWQDPATGLWWQVTDQGAREGNYLEGTASSMFVYILAKGINRGYLPRETYMPALLKGYEGIIRDLIRPEGDTGRISLTQCCAVAGLGYTNSAGRVRDGTFEYYISEPIIDNDLKGTGPFILAGIELEQLLKTKESPLVVRGWADYERVLARIKAPTFPDRDFPIADFGAKPGAEVTAAIHAAIEACHAAGGGRVVVPAGEWFTMPITLKSNVNLHVAKGATLRFLFEPARHPIVFTRWEGVECMNYSPLIYAFEQENIAVTGEGVLDGQADWENTWWAWNNKAKAQRTMQIVARNKLIEMGETGVPVGQRVFGEGSYLRPNFIQPYRCRNILIEGITIHRSPMWVMNPVLCQNVTVRGVKVVSHGTNNDGCNPESSRDVLIEDCLFDTGDDCIAIKSGRNGDGRRVNVPSENIIVRNCVMKDGHGGVVLGSECSGHIRNVFVEDCEMDSPELDRALRFKNNAVRGGILENVFMRNVRIGRVGEAVVTIDLLYEEGASGNHMPVVRNVQLDNVTSSASPRVLYIRGFEGAVIDGIRISNSTFSGVTETEVIQHAGSISFNNVTITPAKLTRGRNSVPPPEPAKK